MVSSNSLRLSASAFNAFSARHFQQVYGGVITFAAFTAFLAAAGATALAAFIARLAISLWATVSLKPHCYGDNDDDDDDDDDDGGGGGGDHEVMMI